MIATFIIEIALAVYAVVRYRLNAIGRLGVLLLVFLAAFQLAEYMVCQRVWGGAELWSRLGYLAITTLPPLGIHLLYAIAGAKRRPLLMPAYLSGAAFASFFMFVPHAFEGHACMGNYVIFQVTEYAGGLYAIYYYGWLFAALYLAWKGIKELKKSRAKKSQRTRQALGALATGYLLFIVPTVAVNIVSPETTQGIPSIMCGFAVLLAILLVGVALPNSATRRQS